jgi:hypothetical protein
MTVDDRFPTKLESLDDIPEPFHSALAEHLSPVDLPDLFLLHAPAFSTLDQRPSVIDEPVDAPILCAPATTLAVTRDKWLVACETEGGGASVEGANFHDTLFLELTSILLSGQLKIYFAAVGTSYCATMNFDTVGEELYRQAIDLILGGIDRTPPGAAENRGDTASLFENWPTKFRNEANRYLPRGQRLLATTQWSAIVDGFQRGLCPAGALLVTERELVLITEEKKTQHFLRGDLQKFGGIITYFPLIRLLDFHVSHHERFAVLALRVHAVHGGEKLEIIFPADHEKALSQAMEKVRAPI